MTDPFRYRRRAYVAVDLSDLDQSLGFYGDRVGLTVVGQTGDTAYLRCSELPQNLVLREGDTPGLARAAFELESQTDLDRAFTYLEDEGFAPEWLTAEEAGELKVGAALRFREPGCGLHFEDRKSTRLNSSH